MTVGDFEAVKVLTHHSLLDLVAQIQQALGIVAQQLAGVGEFHLARAAAAAGLLILRACG